MVATVKTADLWAQTGQTPLLEIDMQCSFLICRFGCLHWGASPIQYTSLAKNAAARYRTIYITILGRKNYLTTTSARGTTAAVDLAVLTVFYLPTFYFFKSSVFSGAVDPHYHGCGELSIQFCQDEFDLLRVWLPSDLICFYDCRYGISLVLCGPPIYQYLHEGVIQFTKNGFIAECNFLEEIGINPRTLSQSLVNSVE